MAKEQFERTKPHVNVGTIGHVAEDTSGLLEFTASGSDSVGNPAPGTVLELTAPASSALQTATVVHSFDDEFLFDPLRSGPATLLDFEVDILPQMMDGIPGLHVTLAIQQGDVFIASAAGETIPAGTDAGTWLTIGDTGLRPRDFVPVDNGPERPDFSREFRFGYAFTGQYSSEGLGVTVGVDNRFVEITTIPEPASIVLVLVLGVSLVWHRLCRGRRRA